MAPTLTKPTNARLNMAHLYKEMVLLITYYSLLITHYLLLITYDLRAFFTNSAI